MIYFVRHGQTDWNLSKKIQGQTNTLLNETGKKQATEARKALENINFNYIFCSPLSRTVETCKIIVGDKHFTIDERLIERGFGEYDGFLTCDFDYEGFWNSNKNQKFERAESLFETEKRVFDFLDELKKYKDKNILIVSHGGIGLLVQSYFCGKPKDGDYLKFLADNGKILKFDYPN